MTKIWQWVLTFLLDRVWGLISDWASNLYMKIKRKFGQKKPLEKVKEDIRSGAERNDETRKNELENINS